MDSIIYHLLNPEKNGVIFETKVGYECVAINNNISDFKHYHVSQTKKGKPPQVKPPSEVKLRENVFNEIKSALGMKRAVRQLSRITIQLDDANHTNKLQRDEIIRSYDLIAVRPTTEKLFQMACSTLDVDIISLNLCDKIPFRMKGNLLKLAMERGIVFEICYAPMIRDSGLRRYVISNGNMLTAAAKGKNIIFSSECEKVMELRGPYDVQNLGVLFDMKENQCKDAVFKNCAKCIAHGETAGKRATKCIITIEKLGKSETTEHQSEQTPKKPSGASPVTQPPNASWDHRNKSQDRRNDVWDPRNHSYKHKANHPVSDYSVKKKRTY